jgi:prepilin-type N-terminal cleavage/methylation domain-containing protein
MPTAKGFSLIEILIAITFVSVLTLVMVSSLTFSSQLRWYNQEKIQASLYAQGGLEAVQALPWSAVANGDYGLDITNDVLKLATPPETLDGRFNRVITISDVHRANQTNGQVYGAIVDTGGYLDPNTKKITATISWRGHSGIDRQLTLIV